MKDLIKERIKLANDIVNTIDKYCYHGENRVLLYPIKEYVLDKISESIAEKFKK